VKVPSGTSAGDIDPLITSVIILIITSTITVMQNDGTHGLRVWIPVHVDMDDRWLDGRTEYSDAYPAGMSVILLVLK
jgi:hypothetical protein